MDNIEFSMRANESGTVNSLFKPTYFSARNCALAGGNWVSQQLVQASSMSS